MREKFKTILSPDIKVGATSQKSKDAGVISGSGTYCDQNLTMLTKISSDNKLKKGDIIVTSGVGGMFPKNLVIGQVENISFDNFDTSKGGPNGWEFLKYDPTTGQIVNANFDEIQGK